jgi:hypothetical protein
MDNYGNFTVRIEVLIHWNLGNYRIHQLSDEVVMGVICSQASLQRQISDLRQSEQSDALSGVFDARLTRLTTIFCMVYEVL